MGEVAQVDDNWTVVGKDTVRKKKMFGNLRETLRKHDAKNESWTDPNDAPPAKTEDLDRLRVAVDKNRKHAAVSKFSGALLEKICESAVGYLRGKHSNSSASDESSAENNCSEENKKARSSVKIIFRAIGVGSPETTDAALKQFTALLEVCDRVVDRLMDDEQLNKLINAENFEVVREICDPVMTATDIALARELGFECTKIDILEKRSSPEDAFVIYYMPHCGAPLYWGVVRNQFSATDAISSGSDVTEKNAHAEKCVGGQSVGNVVIIGNEFSDTRREDLSDDDQHAFEHFVQLLPRFEQVKLPADKHCNSFYGTYYSVFTNRVGK